jgi:diacylglycerol O-acyltransferase
MSVKPLNPLDISWLMVESRDTPMHVGGLIPFTLPDDAAPDFLRQLLADFRACTEVAPPWNHRLRKPGLRGLRPVWEEEQSIDLEHHVRLSALPQPGGERELGQLIARLHSQPLDLSRPPWECEFIEGLEGRRFALYIKMHHSLIDGISGMKLLVRSMSHDAEASRRLPPFFAVGFPARLRQRREAPAPTAAQVVNGLIDATRDQLSTLPDIVRAFTSMVRSTRNVGEELAIPFDTPVSIINGRIKQPRRFATQQFSIARRRTVADAANATLNDVVLAICGAALRRFLDELGALPE